MVLKLRKIAPVAVTAQNPAPAQLPVVVVEDAPRHSVSEVVDPRPDYAEDSLAWHHLLRLAFAHDQDCWRLLHFLRIGGLQLSKQRSGALRLGPRYSPGQWDQEAQSYRHDETWWLTGEEGAWERDREELAVHRDLIGQLLKDLPAEYPAACASLPKL